MWDSFIIHSFINLYSAPSTGLLRGLPTPARPKSTVLSLIKNASVRVTGSRLSQFQTIWPTTEKGYGSVGDLEAHSDWGQERVRYEDERVDRDGWIDGEEFAKVLWLVVLH